MFVLLGATFIFGVVESPHQNFPLKHIKIASSTTHIQVAGYTQVVSDGGIFNFGTSQFHGSMGGQPLNKPIVGMATDPATGGYWEVASDGGIFSFNAPFFGSMGGQPLNKPIVGMASVNPTSTLLPAGAKGYDLANYQCSDFTGAAGGAFYILGVSGGPFFNNTCIQQEGAFGGPTSEGYLFLGNTVAAPVGTPPAPSCPSSISETLCPSYQIGYQQAKSSYTWATSNGVYPAMWWLDVEQNNCSIFGPTGQWMQAPGQPCGSTEYNTAANAATVQGAFAALNATGQEVGVYSTPVDWQQITGNLNLPYGTLLWEPIQQGNGCSLATGFGGGVVTVVQYQTTGSFDQDIAC